MTDDQLTTEIREANMTYLMLAQKIPIAVSSGGAKGTAAHQHGKIKLWLITQGLRPSRRVCTWPHSLQ